MYTPPRIIESFDLFVDHVLDWIKSRILKRPKPPKTSNKLFDDRWKSKEEKQEFEANRKRHQELKLPALCGLAMDAIIGSVLLPGVGRYTLEEVFFKAGLCTPLVPIYLLNV
jgi:hypothetical protein